MKILSVKNLSKDTVDFLSRQFTYVYKDRKQLENKDVQEVDIVIGNIPVHLLPHCHTLQYLQLESAGHESYVNCIPHNVRLCNASGIFGESIAEHLVMSTLALFRDLDVYFAQQKNHVYQKKRHISLIQGSTFIIYGTGDIGSCFAKKIKALGGYTIGVNRSGKKLDCFDEVYGVAGIDAQLHRADVIAFGLPKYEGTNHIFKEAQLKLVKSSVVILNVGRSNAISQEMICEALQNKQIGKAMLDVFNEEPIRENHPIWDIPGLLITPHVSGTFAHPLMHQLFEILVKENLMSFKKGETLRNEVDLIQGY